MSEEPLQQALERISNLENQVRRNRHNNRALFWLVATLISASLPFLFLESDIQFGKDGFSGTVRSRALNLPLPATLFVLAIGGVGLGVISKDALSSRVSGVRKVRGSDETLPQ